MNQRIYQIKRSIERESPAILTAFAVSGVITTTVLAVRATPKAMKLLNQEAYKMKCQVEEIATSEIIKIAWKPYIPAFITGSLTIVCILGSHSIHAKRNAAIAGLYSIATGALQEYQSKVVETLGEKKEQRLRDEIAQDRLDKNPINDGVIFANGDVLFYDSLSGRYFKSSMEKVRSAINTFNYELLTEMYKPVNDFYYMLGLEDVESGRSQGWNIENGQLNVYFSAKIINSENSQYHNEPCIVMTYMMEPKFL